MVSQVSKAAAISLLICIFALAYSFLVANSFALHIIRSINNK